MAAWAYACRATHEPGPDYFVAREAVDALAAEDERLWLMVDHSWLCVQVDRARPVEVEGMLLRDAAVARPGDCPLCEAAAASQTDSPAGAAEPPAPAGGARAPLAQPLGRDRPKARRATPLSSPEVRARLR